MFAQNVSICEFLGKGIDKRMCLLTINTYQNNDIKMIDFETMGKSIFATYLA